MSDGENEVLTLPCSRCGKEMLPPKPAQLAEIEKRLGPLDGETMHLVCPACVTPEEKAALSAWAGWAGALLEVGELPEHVAERQARVEKKNDRMLAAARWRMAKQLAIGFAAGGAIGGLFLLLGALAR